MLSSKAKRELKIDQRQILIDSIEIGIPSPQQICLWGSRQLPNGKSVGLVKNSKTVNYKRFTPFRDGLFCERIFGPVSSLVCACGKKQPHSKVTFCEKCEVEYIDQRARRYRLGYISLLSPVTHIWYLKGRPSYLSLFLGKRKKSVVALAYCNAYLIEHGLTKKENERQIWPFMPSFSNAEKLLQNNFYKEAFKPFLPSSCTSVAFAKSANKYKSKNLKKVTTSLLERVPSKAKENKAFHVLFKQNKAKENKKNETKYLKTSFLDLGLLTSYGTSSYVRQQTLPFLPTFVSHFYLRDALLNFLYSSATYNDIPIMEYCHIKRWEPLQDVHKLMARQSVDQFKKDLPYVRSFKKYSEVLLKHNLVPKKKNLKKLKKQNRVKSFTKAKLALHLRKAPFKYTFGMHLRRSSPKRYRFASPSRQNILRNELSSMLMHDDRFRYERQTKQSKTNFVATNENLLRRSKTKLPTEVKTFTSVAKLDCSKEKLRNKIFRLVKVKANALSTTLHKDPLIFLSRLESGFNKKLRPYKASQSCFLNHLATEDKTGPCTKKSAPSKYASNSNKRMRPFVRKTTPKCTVGFTQVKHSTYVPIRHLQTAFPSFGAKEISPSFAKSKLGTNVLRSPSLCTESALQVQSETKQRNCATSNCKKICLYNSAKSNDQSSKKRKIHEDTNTALLSHLELTTIREILSYTGGGALQQLLQQFDQHDLCKFLFAEKQILRVLYQKHFTHFDILFAESLRTGIGVASRLRDKSILLQIEDLYVSDSSINGSKTVDKRNEVQNHFECFASKKQILDSDNEVGFAKAKHSNEYKKENCYASSGCTVGFDSVKSRTANFVPNQTLMRFVKEAKKSDLQKKQIVRLSRRIYKVARRLKVTQLLTLNHRRPEWMILSHLPVLPPELRPILQMSEKVIVASDLNIMYQRVIYRNNRHLRVRFIDFHLVTAIQRLVQDAVDRLMENGKGGSKPYYTQGGRPLKSLSDILKGKKGRFRLNLLGKRVDFSGRSVIVVAPSLKIHECGLPKDIALELYHYFLLRQLIVKKHCASIVTAKKMMKSKSSLMWEILRELMYHHPVLLNRAPTLHRLGIQAFQPKLVLGNAIWLHPLVCSGFNADFDGDQMGVHLPLSFAARAESWDLLWSRNNLLSPATGQPMLLPSQDMVLGFYYMTAKANEDQSLSWTKTKPLHLSVHRQVQKKLSCCPKSKQQSCSSMHQNLFRDESIKERPTKSVKDLCFLNTSSIITSFQKGQIKLHTPVWLYWKGQVENENISQIPLELRVYGFGLQRYVYDKYINSNYFTKTKIVQSEALLEFVMHQKRSSLRTSTKSEESFGKKSKICNSSAVLQIEKTKFLYFVRKFGASICTQTSSICSESKSFYIRTTAGRVLLNNIMKLKRLSS
uniref:RNA polymerase beta' subunit n=1 Tax=Polulichloris maxima TaxID=2704661 RepID=UPI0024113C14|nr:RNA polymerase beta' subunit [Polulichloris maxima]WDY13270.1 RNA polymerase beta' subunit [Polulichloris maxima]